VNEGKPPILVDTQTLRQGRGEEGTWGEKREKLTKFLSVGWEGKPRNSFFRGGEWMNLYFFGGRRGVFLEGSEKSRGRREDQANTFFCCARRQKKGKEEMIWGGVRGRRDTHR